VHFSTHIRRSKLRTTRLVPLVSLALAQLLPLDPTEPVRTIFGVNPGGKVIGFLEAPIDDMPGATPANEHLTGIERLYVRAVIHPIVLSPTGRAHERLGLDVGRTEHGNVDVENHMFALSLVHWKRLGPCP